MGLEYKFLFNLCLFILINSFNNHFKLTLSGQVEISRKVFLNPMNYLFFWWLSTSVSILGFSLFSSFLDPCISICSLRTSSSGEKNLQRVLQKSDWMYSFYVSEGLMIAVNCGGRVKLKNTLRYEISKV